MKLFHFLAIPILFVVGISPAWAAQDSITPTKISFDVVPGEVFSYDLTYRSGIGGVYDFFTKAFTYNEKGEKVFLDAPPDWIFFEASTFSFEAGEEKYLPIEVRIPAESQDQDIFFAHFLRRRSPERQTFELGSLMFLRVGKPSLFQGDLEVVPIHYGEKAGVFDAVPFRFQNTSERYFAITPELQFLDEMGQPAAVFRGDKNFVFPSFTREMNVYNFSGKDLSFLPPFQKARLLVFDEDDSLLGQQEVVLQEGDVFVSQERPESFLSQPRIRKDFQFLYHPTFRIIAVCIGLTLIVASFLLRKK